MMPGAKDLLDVVMHNLQRYVAPQITTDDGRMTLLLVTYVLGFMYVEEHDRPALHARRYAALEPLLRELQARFAASDVDAGESGGAGSAGATNSAPGLRGNGSSASASCSDAASPRSSTPAA